jgi:hypothetical protein
MRECLEAKFVDAHENLCDSVGGLQLVLAVMVFGKEGYERDKSTQNVVNYERSMVKRGVVKFDDSELHLASHRIWPHLFQPCSFHSSLHFVYSYVFQIPPFQEPSPPKPIAHHGCILFVSLLKMTKIASNIVAL